jgi:uncharacterized iron-regulated protein
MSTSSMQSPFGPRVVRTGAVLLLTAGLAGACASTLDNSGPSSTPDKTSATWVDLSSLEPMDTILSRIVDARVVFVGETHTRYDHHLNQLAVLRAMHERHGKVAVGVEWFQQPFQQHLDDFVAGRIGEAEMLEKTGYFDRWRFDYRLYRPIIQYAKENRIPIIALNAAKETTDRVSEVGVEGLSADERAGFPEIDRSNEAYARRLKQTFDQHPTGPKRNFDRFLDVQLTWDESMADRTARFLKENPDHRIVVLAGAGHIAYGHGIPDRVKRRMPGVKAVSVMFENGYPVSPDLTDILVFSPEKALPEAGLLGLFLDTTPEGLKVRSFSEQSAGKAAGIGEGDTLLEIDGKPLTSYAALRMAMLESKPGQKVSVKVRHEGLFGRASDKTVEVTLK